MQLIVKQKLPIPVLSNCRTSAIWGGVTSPLLVSPNLLPSYIVIIYILLLLLCSDAKYLSRIISFCPFFIGTAVVQSICYFYLCTLLSSSCSVAPNTYTLHLSK